MIEEMCGSCMRHDDGIKYEEDEKAELPQLPINHGIEALMRQKTMVSLATTDPLLAEDFKDIRFEGLLLCLQRRDDTGLMVCFPYADRPHCDLTVVFHQRFVHETDRVRLSTNSCVEFSIGVNPTNFGQGLYGYVALDIKVAQHGFTIEYIPVTLQQTERRERGRIVVAPRSTEHRCFIYNPFADTVCRLGIGRHEDPDDYREGIHVRYNEEEGGRAIDVLPVTFDPEVADYVTSDNFVRYKAKRFIAGKKLKIDEDRCIEFKNVILQRDDFASHTDMFYIIESAETYLNVFLNDSGGVMFFGVSDDGTVHGQQMMSKNKREYIRNAIGQRLDHFKPSVSPDFYSVEFKEVIDMDGYCVVDTFVVIVCVLFQFANIWHLVHVPVLYLCHCQMRAVKLNSGENREQHIKYATSKGQIYERSVEGHLTPINELQYRRRQASLEQQAKVCSGVKPQFVALLNIDGDGENAEDDNDFLNDRDDDDEEEKMDCVPQRVGFQTAPQQYLSQQHVQDIPSAAMPSMLAADMPTEALAQSALEYTTPELNAKPIPGNSAAGVEELKRRVQVKMNAMMNAPQCVGRGFRVTVSFGKAGREKSESGDGRDKRSAIYAAYQKLVPRIIPKSVCVELMNKWVPGYRKADNSRVSTSMPAGVGGHAVMKHPKSVLLEYANKYSFAPPKTNFSDFCDSSRNVRVHTARVTFYGKTVECQSSQKKDAEKKCFQQLSHMALDRVRFVILIF